LILLIKTDANLTFNRSSTARAEAALPDRLIREARSTQGEAALAEDIIEYFKQRVALPNAARYQTRIDQALREIIIS